MISRCREFRSQCWRRKRSTPTVMEAVPAVTQRQDSMFKRIHEKVSAPQAQSIDGRNDGHPSCAIKNKFTTVQPAQKMITDRTVTGADHPEDPEREVQELAEVGDPWRESSPAATRGRGRTFSRSRLARGKRVSASLSPTRERNTPSLPRLDQRIT